MTATFCRHATRATIWLGAALLFAQASCSKPPRPNRRLEFLYAALWRVATNKCKPTYPPSSLAGGVEGVAVAEVEFAQTGKAKTVHVLQSPDAATRQATGACAASWAVPPVDDEALIRRGKLYFYFLNANSGGLVLAANSPQDRELL